MRIHRLSFLLLAFAFVAAPIARATTRIVPTQQPTIQRAIWASAGGDTIAVLPGTYVENIEIDRVVVLRSTGGPAVTVIDGSNPTQEDSASTIIMRAGEVIGFDIRNGIGSIDSVFSEWHGGGIHATGFGTVRGSWIHNNHLSGYRGVGAGVYANGSITVRGNRIYNNRIDAEWFGFAGGVAGHGDNALVEDNEIFGNHVEHGNAPGANGWATFRHNIFACNTVVIAGSEEFGSSALFSSSQTVEGNTIVGNWGSTESAPAAMFIWVLECRPACPVNVFGNVVAFNIGAGGGCNLDHGGSEVTFACNDFYGNTGLQFAGNCGNVIGQNGNINVDPLFGSGTCPYESGAWCLAPNSPLLPQHSPPGCGLIGAVGQCPFVGVADAPPTDELRTGPAVPNPFAERTTIPFYLARQGAVEITIVDVLGRTIRAIQPGSTTPGNHSVEWDGRTDAGARAASGAYIAVIRSGVEEVTRTLLLVR